MPPEQTAAEGVSPKAAKNPSEENKAGTVWQEDMAQWTDELRTAFKVFVWARNWAGEEWDLCIRCLVSLEKAWGHPAKGLLAAPNSSEEHPGEVEKFMRYGRKWGTPMELTSEIGPRAVCSSFADRWWGWWDAVRPKSRKEEDGSLKRVDSIPSSDWEEVGKMAGCNGLLLYVERVARYLRQVY
jgi:hypothetical protein